MCDDLHCCCYLFSSSTGLDLDLDSLISLILSRRQIELVLLVLLKVMNEMASALKTMVSKKKRRLVEDGYNLDLTYITPKIIGMGFPASNVESIWRNNRQMVKEFLESKHKDKYWIYNLCSEKFYDASLFNGRVDTFPFDDHNPPNFNMIRPFCEAVESWFAKDPENVAAIHCKAGKGRTGVMICCLLLHEGTHQNASEVLKYYAKKRTIDEKGVTIPSQRRYVSYYSTFLKNQLVYRPTKLYLTSIVLDPTPNFSAQLELFFEVYQMAPDSCSASASKVYESQSYLFRRNRRQVRLEVEPPITIKGDVKIEFSTRIRLEKKVGLRKTKEFHFWFNTFFAQQSNLHEEEDLSHQVFGPSNMRPRQPPRPQQQPPTPSRPNNVEEDDISPLIKTVSISDEQLLTASAASNLTSAASDSHNQVKKLGDTVSNQSFIEKRSRHSSVPQTASSSSSSIATIAAVASISASSTSASTASSSSSATSKGHHSSGNNNKSSSSGASNTTTAASTASSIKGTRILLSLKKLLIDKAAKDKTGKYEENFSVSLCLVRPEDSTAASTTASTTASVTASTNSYSSSENKCTNYVCYNRTTEDEVFRKTTYNNEVDGGCSEDEEDVEDEEEVSINDNNGTRANFSKPSQSTWI